MTPVDEQADDVAITQSAPFNSAEIGAQIGRATTKNDGHIDSARNCEPASAANLSATKFQFVTSLQMRDMPGQAIPVIQSARQIRRRTRRRFARPQTATANRRA